MSTQSRPSSAFPRTKLSVVFAQAKAQKLELELELIQPHMAQKPMLRGEVGCACVKSWSCAAFAT